MKQKILYIYCAGGFGREVSDIAKRENALNKRWSFIRFVDDVVAVSLEREIPIVKFHDSLTDIYNQKCEFLIANGEPFVRRKILAKLEQHNARLGSLLDYSSTASDTATVGEGVIVAGFCSLANGSALSRNSCVNVMSIVGHDVFVGANSVVSSMVNLGGGCTVGENTYIGMGALVKERVKIGSNSIIGMGSVVYSDVPDDVIALGNPARVVKQNTEQRVFK